MPPNPPRRKKDENREIDYLTCQECRTPCYIFEMEMGAIKEAQCLVCGNDEPKMFLIGEEMDSDSD